MAALPDSLGTIAIDIVGDYSQLQSDLEQAQGAAEQAGEAIANAFSGADAESVALFSEQLERLAPAAEMASGALAETGTGAVEAGEKAAEAEISFDALGEKLLEIGTELAAGLGFIETVKSLIEVTGQVQMATVSLTALMGSAQEATSRLQELRDMSDEQGLSFPMLVEANQRMVAFGISTEAIQPALQAAADAAAAMNSTVSETSNAMDRMAISGMANARQLVALALSTKDLAEAMGTTEDQAKATFKVLDESTRIQVLTRAIEDVRQFRGLSQEVAETLPRQWQGVKNAFEEAFQSIGSMMAPIIKGFMDWVKSIGEAIDLLARLAHATGRFAIGEGFTLPPEAPGGAAAGTAAAPISNEDLEASVKAQKAAADAAAEVILNADKLKPISKEYQTDLALRVGMEEKEEAQLKSTASAIEAYGAHLDKLGIDTSTMNLAEAYFNQQMINATVNMATATEEMPPLVDMYGKLTTETTKAADEQKEAQKGITEMNKTLDEMLGKAKPPLDAVHEGFAKIDAELEKGDFAAAERNVRRLATDSLPAAISAYEKIIQSAREHGATEGEVLALQEKQYQMEIELGAQTGQNVTTAIVGLQNAKIRTQELIDASQGLGEVYVGLTNTFMNMWDQFSKGISDAIVNSRNFGDAMINVLKRIETEILDILIGFAMKKLRDSILEAVSSFGSLDSTVQQTAADATRMSNQLGGAGGAALGPISGGGGAPGGLTSLGGGGLGLVDAIGSVVGAVAGVVGDVQQAHANTLLGRIEVTTRGMLNEALNLRADIWSHFNNLNAHLDAGIKVMGGAGGATFQNCTFTGITQDLVNQVAQAIMRQYKLAGG